MRSFPAHLAAVMAVCVLSASDGHSQVTLDWLKYQSPQPTGGWFGYTFGVTDLDGDGFDDVVAMEPLAAVAGQNLAGRGWVGRGPQLEPWTPFASNSPAQNERLGATGVSLGDVNGDGETDLLVSAPSYQIGTELQVGRAHLFYGPDFQTEVILDDPTPDKFGRFTNSVLLVDVTGDGRDDLFIGAPGADEPLPNHQVLNAVGEVFFYDATDLDTPIRLTNPNIFEGGRFGSSLATAFMDGDGLPDILVGQDQTGVFEGEGQLHVFSGSDLALHQTVLPPPTVPSIIVRGFGLVQHVGDMNGDGEQDLVVAAPETSTLCSQEGVIFILPGPDFDTASHVLEYPVEGCFPTSWFGQETAVADLDKDDHPDIIVGNLDPFDDDYRTYIFYGPDYQTSQYLTHWPPLVVSGFGEEVATADLDGDGFVELLLHAPQASQNGSIYVYDVQTLVESAPSLSVSAGGDVVFDFDAGPDQAGEAYLVAIGLSGSYPGTVVEPGVYLPLNVDGATLAGLSLLDTPLLQDFVGVLDGEGKASFALHLEPFWLTDLVGQTMAFAAITGSGLGALGIGSSSARVTFEP